MIKQAITKFSLVVIREMDPEEFSEWIESTDIEEDIAKHFVLCSRLVRQRTKRDVKQLLRLFESNFDEGEKG